MVEDNIVEVTGVRGEEIYNNEYSGKEHITAIVQRIKRINPKGINAISVQRIDMLGVSEISECNWQPGN